jgi:hypothetical protein
MKDIIIIPMNSPTYGGLGYLVKICWRLDLLYYLGSRQPATAIDEAAELPS